MKLFRLEGYNLTISEEAYALKPFKDLWRRDKSKNKERALMELAFVYFMEDARSDYQIYIDKEERCKQVKLGEGLPDSWQPDRMVQEAQQFYSGFKTESALLLEDLKIAVNTLRKGMITQEELESIDPEKKPSVLNNYAGVIAKMADLAAKIDETEKKMSRETLQSDKVRGSVEKAMFEDDL